MPETLETKRRLENFFELKIESLYRDQTPEQQAAELGPELWKTREAHRNAWTKLLISLSNSGSALRWPSILRIE